jgi:hypothetical protein
VGVKQTLLPWDDTFPRTLTHIANKDLELEVLFYGLLSAPQGGVPVVATNGVHFFAGEAIYHEGEPVLAAVNLYGDVTTAKTYALSIFVL